MKLCTWVRQFRKRVQDEGNPGASLEGLAISGQKEERAPVPGKEVEKEQPETQTRGPCAPPGYTTQACSLHGVYSRVGGRDIKQESHKIRSISWIKCCQGKYNK